MFTPLALLGSALLAVAFTPATAAAAAANAANANPTAPTNSVVAFERNFKPEGAWGDHGQEASPFFLNHKLYMMQSIMGRFPADGSQGGHRFATHPYQNKLASAHFRPFSPQCGSPC